MSAIDRLKGLVSTVAIKAPVACATTAAITLSGEQTIDGVLTASSRVLVKNQADATTNGIYVSNTGTWTRDVDFAGTGDCVQGTMILVVAGTVNSNAVFTVATASPVIGTSSLTFNASGSAALSIASSYMLTTFLQFGSAAAVLTGINAPKLSGGNTWNSTQTFVNAIGVGGPFTGFTGHFTSTLLVDGVLTAGTYAGTGVGKMIPNYLSGFTLSNDSGTPNTILDIAGGACMDSTNTSIIQYAGAAVRKTTGGAFVQGDNQPAMGQGLTIGNNTWYHVFAVIANAGAPDFYFDTDPGAANKPASVTAFRRIGSFRTDGSAHIKTFIQDGDLFQWLAPVVDVNAAANPGAAAVTRILTVPTGVNVQAVTQLVVGNSGAAAYSYGYLSDLATTDTAASLTFSDTAGAATVAGGVAGAGARVVVRTNTSAQIRSRLSFSDASCTITINTLGWIDRRGRDG